MSNGTRNSNPGIQNLGIPAEFCNPVISGLAASCPAITELKNVH